MQDIKKLEDKLGYSFKTPSLLHNALTHSSFVNETPDPTDLSNERLEFLGDAVLQLAVSDYIYKNYPHLEEGKMSQYRSVVVCEEGLFELAKELDLGNFLNMAKGEENTGGRKKASLLSDATEAVIAAVYLDSDFETAKGFVISHLEQYIISAVDQNKNNLDAKSRLQEFVMAKSNSGKHRVDYILVGEKGPDHNKSFVIKAVYDGKISAVGEGSSKKKAEQQAAKELLKILEK